MYLFLSPLRDPLQAILVLGQHAHQSAVASRPIPVASVQAENVVGAAEVVDADVAVVSGFEVLLRLFADHGVRPPVVSFAFCWAHISSAKGMSGTSKHTEEEGDTGGSGQSLIMLQSEAIFHAVTAIGSFLSSLSPT